MMQMPREEYDKRWLEDWRGGLQPGQVGARAVHCSLVHF